MMRTCNEPVLSTVKHSLQLLFGVSHAALITSAAPKPGILGEYSRLLKAGKLHPDATQLAAVQALQLLQDSLALRLAKQLTAAAAQAVAGTHNTADASARPSDVEPDQHAGDGSSAGSTEDGRSLIASKAADTGNQATSATNTGSSSSSGPIIQGAYLWGPVGSGKTLLMDMFLRTLPAVAVPSGPLTPNSDLAGSLRTKTDASSSASDTEDSFAAADPAAQQQQQQQGEESMQQVPLTAHRIHYHEFMLAVHEQLHQLQQSLPRIVTYSRAGLPVYRYATPPEDPILVVARAAASGLDLLCLDELHVTDVADAMLLSRLFGEILRCGCGVIFTSNRPARDLYKGGLSRKYFEPFIRLIDDRLLQLKVAGGRDYRLLNLNQQLLIRTLQRPVDQDVTGTSGAAGGGSSSTGLWFMGPDADQQLQQHWDQLAAPTATAAATNSSSGRAGHSAEINLPFGRTLWIPRALYKQPVASCSDLRGASSSSSSPGDSSNHPLPQQQQQKQQGQELAAACFTFKQLCSNQGSRQSLEHAGALSSNDYLALVRLCPMIFVRGIPQLAPRSRDEARRLVTLIDLVYEAHTAKPGSCRLVVSGEVSPQELFLPLLGAAAAQGVNPNLGKSGDKLDVMKLIQDHRATALASIDSNDALGAAAGESGAAAAAAQPNSIGVVGSVAGSQGHVGGPVSALLPEEVLMYHRASSRLAELCSVVTTSSVVDTAAS